MHRGVDCDRGAEPIPETAKGVTDAGVGVLGMYVFTRKNSRRREVHFGRIKLPIFTVLLHVVAPDAIPKSKTKQNRYNSESTGSGSTGSE